MNILYNHFLFLHLKLSPLLPFPNNKWPELISTRVCQIEANAIFMTKLFDM